MKEHEEDGEQRVEVVGDGGHEGVEAVLAHVTATAHEDTGAIMQTGAAVESMIQASFSWLTRNLSVTGRMTAPTVRQLK